MGAARRLLLLAIVSAALFSCTPDEGTPVTLYSEPALDGVAVWEGAAAYSGGLDSTTVMIGDNDPDTVMRCVVSFDLATLPAEAQIVSATLRMYQDDGWSGDSYDAADGLDTVIVDNISYDDLTSWENLWSGSTTGSDIGIGPLASSFSANTWHEIDVTPSAQFEFSDYHNGRLQFRIYHHYENNHNGIDDWDEWVMGDNPTHQPELVIVYR